MERFGAISRVAATSLGMAGRLSRLRSSLVTMGETLLLALDSLRAHKLRSFLTLLGVILAVTTLVSVMSVIAGLNMYVADLLANLGANVDLVHRFGIMTIKDTWIKAHNPPPTTIKEYELLLDTHNIDNALPPQH